MCVRSVCIIKVHESWSVYKKQNKNRTKSLVACLLAHMSLSFLLLFTNLGSVLSLLLLLFSITGSILHS